LTSSNFGFRIAEHSLFRTGLEAEEPLQVHFAAAREFKEFEENFSMKAHALSVRILSLAMFACFFLAGVAAAQNEIPRQRKPDVYSPACNPA